MELNIEYLPVDQLTPYEHNARKHQDKDLAAIVSSIREFGFDDPIGVWGGHNVIVEGHGRLMAAKKLGMEKVPVIHLDHLTDEQRRAYALAHNRTAELSAWDDVVKELELSSISEIDMSAFGFFGPVQSSWFDRDDRDGTEQQEGNEDYNAFLEKFEAKKTTDDCYTPENVYDAVADWVAHEYDIKRTRFVRPFYPGGDYKNERYKPDSVVVDNPPFSILAEIVDFYVGRGIKFFMFAPGLATLNYCNRDNVCAICTYASITYENGASVCTSFLTNLGDGSIVARSTPDLYQAIDAANDVNEKALHVQMPKYEYPEEVLTAAKFGWLAKYGQAIAVRRDESLFIRQLDAMKEIGKGIYGNALLLSERAAAERAAAERAAAERAAATKWKLSDRERELVKSLGKGL